MSFAAKRHDDQYEYEMTKRKQLLVPLSSVDCPVDLDETEFSESSDCEDDFTPIAVIHKPNSKVTQSFEYLDDDEDDDLMYVQDAPMMMPSIMPSSKNKVSATFTLLAAALLLIATYCLGLHLGHDVAATHLHKATTARDQLVQDQESLLWQVVRERQPLAEEQADLAAHIASLQDQLAETNAALELQQAKLEQAQLENAEARDECDAVANDVNNRIWTTEQDLHRLQKTLLRQDGPEAADILAELQTSMQKSVASLYDGHNKQP